MVVLKKIGVWSMAKLQAILMAFVGLIVGIITALVLSAISPKLAAIEGVNLEMLPISSITGIGFLTIIAYPIIYGIIGLVGGAVGAWLYNLIARWVGGIEMEFEQ